jgi:hypothetical protein
MPVDDALEELDNPVEEEEDDDFGPDGTINDPVDDEECDPVEEEEPEIAVELNDCPVDDKPDELDDINGPLDEEDDEDKHTSLVGTLIVIDVTFAVAPIKI